MSGPPLRGEWLPHAVVLAVCAGMVLAAVLLTPPRSDGVVRAAGIAVPELCLLRNTFGIPCPGCGLTRSFVCALHGDLAASLHYHRLGWLVLLYVVLQALRHLVWLVAPPVRDGLERRARWLDRGVVLLGALLLANWIAVLIAL